MYHRGRRGWPPAADPLMVWFVNSQHAYFWYVFLVWKSGLENKSGVCSLALGHLVVPHQRLFCFFEAKQNGFS